MHTVKVILSILGLKTTMKFALRIGILLIQKKEPLDVIETKEIQKLDSIMPLVRSWNGYQFAVDQGLWGW